MMAWIKPAPYTKGTLRPFWDGLKERRFLLPRCNTCGTWYFPPAFCKNHKNEPFFGSLSWTAASGRGKIVAFNITKTALRAAFKDDVPYVYALIRLEEGPIISSNIINCEANSVYIDMPVSIVFWDIDDLNCTIPYFEPDLTAVQAAQSSV
jgi:uncharacterized OB-fold protein